MSKRKKYRVSLYEIFLLIIISVIVFLTPKLFIIAKEHIFTSSLNMKKVKEFEIDEETKNKQVFLIKDKLMVQSKDKLVCFNAEAEETWVRPLKSSKTKIIKWSDSYVIADLDSGRIACVDSDNKVTAEKNLQGKITDICVSHESIYLLKGGENSIVILDKKLKKTGLINHQNGDVIKITCDYDSSELILYTISVKNNEINTFCIVYDNKGKIIASLDLNKSLIFDIFVEDNIVMISDESFLVFNRLVRPIAEYNYPTSLIDADFNNTKLYVICNTSEGNLGEKELKVYDSSLNQINSTKVSETTNKLVAGQKYLLTASEQRISIMNQNLKIIQDINLKNSIKEVKWISDDSFYLVSDNKLIIYSNK